MTVLRLLRSLFIAAILISRIFSCGALLGFFRGLFMMLRMMASSIDGEAYGFYMSFNGKKIFISATPYLNEWKNSYF